LKRISLSIFRCAEITALLLLAGCARGEFRVFSIPVIYPAGYERLFNEDTTPARGVTVLDVVKKDFDGDKKPDGLLVKFTPTGRNGEPVKKLGHVSLVAYGEQAGEARKVLGEWKFAGAELARSWKQADTGDAYYVRVFLPVGGKQKDGLLKLVFVTRIGTRFESEKPFSL